MNDMDQNPCFFCKQEQAVCFATRCGDDAPASQEEEPCDHPDGFDREEGNTCLICGYDGSEDIMADAYDRAKDMRKYGDT
jgi:hypothetical protein